MFKYAIDIILRRPLRTFLTSLGITIAVFLISFILFGMQDLKGVLVNEFETRFSPKQVIITGSGFNSFMGGAMPVTYDQEVVEKAVMNQDFIDDMNELSYVESVSRSVFFTGLEATLTEKEVAYPNAMMTGWDITSDDPYFVEFFGDDKELENGYVWVGTFLADFYKEDYKKLIGKEIVIKPSGTTIFSSKSKSMIGKEFTYTIAGVYDSGQDKNDVVFTIDDSLEIARQLGGFDTSQEYVKQVGFDILYVNADTEYHAEFKKLIKDEYGYDAITSSDIVSIISSITNGLTVALVLFGFVSGLVAGIGIINTMIMSIYEQTKEIGIIKALGASDQQVRTIFLIQSGLMGLFGGVLGISLILLLMLSLDGLVVSELQKAGLSAEQFFHFDLGIAVVIAIASIMVGIISGVYPASRAASLDPIKALRYE